MTHECSNLRKILLWRKSPSSELSFIALYQKTITRNSESPSFKGLLKSLLALLVMEETRQTWPMLSDLKAVVDSERFQVIVFQYRAENDNSEFRSFTFKLSIIPYVTKKSELSFLCIGPKTISRNSDSPENEFRDFREFRVIVMALIHRIYQLLI